MRRAAPWAALALAFCLACGGTSPAGAADRFAAAAEHYRNQRWQQTCDELAQLLKEDPAGGRAAEARFYFGEALVQLGRWQEARTQFSQLLADRPEGPQARQALFRAAESAYMIGDDRAAKTDLEAFRRRYDNDPLCAYVLPYLGSLELQSGNSDDARKLFSESLERFQDGPLAAEAEFGLAQALDRSDRLDEARARYRAIVEGNGPLAEQALLQLAVVENSLGDWQAALAAVDQLSARFPGSSLTNKARLSRGYALVKLGKAREAQETLQTIVGDPALRVEASYWLALAQKAQDNPQAAAETLRAIAVEEKHPLAPAIAYHTADALVQAGELAAAREELDRSLARFAESSWADDAELARLHIAIGEKQHDEALRLAEELIARYPKSPLVAQATLAKGQALAALDKPAEAIAALEALAGKNVESEIRAHAQASIAVAQAKLGHWEQARQALESLRSDPSAAGLASETASQVAEAALAAGNSALSEELFRSIAGADATGEAAAGAQSGLAWSHFKAGRWAEAADAFAKVLESHPGEAMAAEAALMRGRSLEHLQQFEPALAAYRDVGERYPKSARAAEALWCAARLYEQLDRPSEARQSYAWLVDRHVDFAQLDAALFRYAWLLESSDVAASDKLLERVRSEFPHSTYGPEAALRLAQHAVDDKRPADAESLLAELREPAVPDKVRQQALYLTGRLELARGNWLAAVGPLERLIQEFPDGELALPASYLIAEAEFRQEHYDKAATLLAELAAKTQGRADPWLATAELRRAQALAHQRSWSEALEVARGIASRFPDFDQQYEIDYLVGRSLAAAADFAAARKSYAKVLASPAGSRSETGAMARWMTGESYFHQENYVAALAEYAQVDDAYPRWHAAALLQAGKCAEALGRWNDAAAHYQKLIDTYPDGSLSAEATRRLSAVRGRAAGRPPELK